MDHRHIISLSDAYKMNQHTHTKQNNTYNNRQKISDGNYCILGVSSMMNTDMIKWQTVRAEGLTHATNLGTGLICEKRKSCKYIVYSQCYLFHSKIF
jgi:hypothetical protein